MILLVISFLAGMLSVLAPCIVSLIPILLTRSLAGDARRSPVFVIGGLAGSIILFSILLKSTTLFISVPTTFWTTVSGGIILLFGIFTLFPSIWEKISLWFRLPLVAQRNLARSSKRRGAWGDVVLGASLGPVFSACSPTYALIVAIILPADPIAGFVYLVSYVSGLTAMLIAVVVFGKKLFAKLGWGLNPGGLFYKILGMLLIVLGIVILSGLDKVFLGVLVENGLFDWQINLESGLIHE